jgi:hypothetical protein
MPRRGRAVGALLAGACLLVLAQTMPAQAADSGEVVQLRQQMQALQARLDALEARASRPAPPAQASAAGSPPPVTRVGDNSLMLGKGVKLTLGGFIEAASIYRSRNETADIASNFNTGIPMPNSPNYHRGEFRGSARQSRLSLLAETDVGKQAHLSAYVETDFLAAGVTSNAVESNSYVPRLRHGYLTADWADAGWHLLAGQTFSLVTTNKQGIVPRTEATPIDPDAQYAVGFAWTRQWGLRAVKDWDKRYWLGVSLESPQTAVASGPNAPAGGTSFNNPGGALLNSTTTYSTDVAPDVVVKLAADPGWGHYELYGLGRVFQSRAANANRTQMGGGVGVAAILPLIANKLDLQLSVLAGQGIGRYGSAQLPDVTVSPLGHLAPLTEIAALVGLVGHPSPEWDVYAYGGTERIDARSYNAAGKPYGYGNPLYDNSGCTVEGAGACAANTRAVTEGTAGFWWKFYHGDMGTMQFGVQGAYVKREVFAGLGGAPSTDDKIMLTSFRFFPF